MLLTDGIARARLAKRTRSRSLASGPEVSWWPMYPLMMTPSMELLGDITKVKKNKQGNYMAARDIPGSQYGSDLLQPADGQGLQL